MSKCSEIQLTEKSKEDFAKWNVAVDLHAAGKFLDAVETYRSMHETSARIFYNMAVAYINLEDFKNAVTCFTSAVEKDENLAVAFFQRGTLYLERKNVQDAISDLEMTRILLRGNAYINYKPLGLFCHLHGFTILYNLAVAYLLDGDDREFRTLLTEAAHYADYFQREHITDTFKLFEEFRWPDIKPIKVTTMAVFAPPKEVTKNLDRKQPSKSRKSMVVFASNENDNTPSFVGSKTVDDLRRDLNEKRSIDGRSGSIKQRLLRKMKSTGDMNVPSYIRENIPTPRKQRHSTGSLRVDSDIPYKSFKERKRSKKSSRKEARATSSKRNSDIADSGGEAVKEDLPENDRTTREPYPCSAKNDCSDCFKSSATVDTDPTYIPIQSVEKDLQTETHTDSLLQNVSAVNKRHFKGKARSLGDIKRTKHKTLSQERRSTGDLEKARSNSLLPLERKKKSHSSLLKLMKSKSNKHNADHPTVVMEGCKAVGDLLTMLVPVDSSIKNNVETSEIETEFGKLDINNNEKSSVNVKTASRYSLGSVFGDRSTVVKYALTEACDILTATVTPTIGASEASKQKKDVSKQRDRVLRGLNEPEQHKTKPSTKKRRAPEPPKLSIGLPLLAAGNLVTALVHQDYDQLADDGSKLIENTKTVTYTTYDSTNIKDVSTIGATRERLSATTSFSNECSKEVNTVSNTSEHLESAFVFPPVSKNPITQDVNNNTLTSKIVQTNCKEPKTPVYVNARMATEVVKRDVESKGSEFGIELDKSYQQWNDFIPSKKSKLFKSKKTKRPPPSYPPPPLRIDFRKQCKSKKVKSNELTLNGFIGNSLLASGKMLGAIVPAAKEEDSDASNLRRPEVNINKTADDISCNENMGELSHLMEATCKIGLGNTEKEEHTYVNISESLGECRTYVDAGDTCLTSGNRSRNAQQEPEGISGILRTSSNILRAFVTSSQDTREAFEEFVHKQRNNRTKHEFCGKLLNEDCSNDSENDYVNMTELRT
ncbi:uncharacterized protein LOC123559483 [Mercenaria mercenaria]|uniref:uncharacterized protein LOC123559483 n=1 Tax=Mercenaria mercenaria TaxID=6596 RepID=UPI00234F3F66|nr:uncharacterized protein LOC123559483 [Mercenaria mercenaria]